MSAMDTKVQIIGVAGTAGAGKDTVADLIARLYGVENLSSGDVVRALTRHIYRLPPDFNPVRDQLYDVANFLRNEVDAAIMVKICIHQVQVLGLKGGIISGLRSMGEADAVRAAGGIIVGVDADPRVRYERIHARKRDTETQKTYEQFLKHDAYENKGLSDTGPGRGIRTIIETADILISNDSSLDTLETRIKEKAGHLFR
jgi:dephospho-CoA kinase